MLRPHLRLPLATLGVAFGACIVSWGANELALYTNHHLLHRYGDDVIIAVLAAWAYWYHGRRQILVRALNHHIRNSLQVILYSGDPKAVEEAKKRAEWALKEATRLLHRDRIRRP
jgi:hypothetical protein